MKSSGKSASIGSSVEPGLPKIVVIPCARSSSNVASRTVGMLVESLLVAVATGPYSSDSASAAARSPDRTAPSMYPFQYVDVSVPAQWIRPTGWRICEP